MRNVSQWVKSLFRSKTVKAVVFGLVALALVFGLSLVPATAGTAQAASCYSMSVYTTRTGAESKPTVLVYWNKPGHPDAWKIKLYFDYKLIPTPRDSTIDTRYPQVDSGGWRGYYIAKRWILSGNFLWDQDYRWRASYCP